MAKVSGTSYIASATPADKTEVVRKWKYLSVDLSTNSTTVWPGPCRIGKIYVDTVLSAHACPIKDGTTTIGSLVASLAVGSQINVFEDTVCDTSLVIDPDDSGTGVILVQYAPL